MKTSSSISTKSPPKQQRLSTIQVGDSTFHGYIQRIYNNKSQALQFQKDLKKQFPDAAHVPVCWLFANRDGQYSSNVSSISSLSGFDEDGEPPNSTGPAMLQCAVEFMTKDDIFQKNCADDSEVQNDAGVTSREGTPMASNGTSSSPGLALAIIRFFGTQLLGVTCGRLSQCYASSARLALHRFFNGPDVPFVQNYTENPLETSIYGLGQGDCEVVLNVVADDLEEENGRNLFQRIRDELEFGGFRGNKGEVLPRLQNLQASVHSSNGIIPVYRYPGNYNGDEWETYEWSNSSLQIKESVERSLPPYASKQTMNHCVTNYYRDGNDFIDHHSDKDLDLNKEGVIISVSLGEERILELRRRAGPKDTTRILLPHCSMLVLGPRTNKLFTHSILAKDNTSGTSNSTRVVGNGPRISLTLRHCTTFLDRKTGRLFGEGVNVKTLEELRKSEQFENKLFLLAFGTLSSILVNRVERKTARIFSDRLKLEAKHSFVILAGLFVLSSMSFHKIRYNFHKKQEEKNARYFFSRTSASGNKY